MIKTLLKITDHATKQIKKKVKASSTATSKGLISAGFELRKSLKEGMLKEAPGGVPWPKTSPWTRFGIIKKARSSHKKAQSRKTKGKGRGKQKVGIGKTTTALKRLAGQARLAKYVNTKPDASIDSTKVQVGFMGRSAARWAEYHQTGPHTIPVTEKMRRMIFASGLILTANEIKIPKRETTNIVLKRNREITPRFINARVAKALTGGDPKSVKMRFH